MSKKLKQMTNDIKNAEIQVKIARQMLIDNNFQDDILSTIILKHLT